MTTDYYETFNSLTEVQAELRNVKRKLETVYSARYREWLRASARLVLDLLDESGNGLTKQHLIRELEKRGPVNWRGRPIHWTKEPIFDFMIKNNMAVKTKENRPTSNENIRSRVQVQVVFYPSEDRQRESA